MDRVARGFLGIAVLITLIQTHHAISEEEFQQKTSIIKSKPEIVEFLKDNKFIISQYGVFFDKMADIFSHVRKTKVGSETMDHVWNETETILKEKRTYGFIKSVLAVAKKVLLSDVGRANILAVANFIKDELSIPHLFEMCLSLKKIILNIFLSEHGLDSLIMIKENNWVLERSPDTAELLSILRNDFPVLSLPTNMIENDPQETQTKENVTQMKSLLGKMSSFRRV